jgi:hypothetical protein
MAESNDDAILREMLALADKLCAGATDTMMTGQYAFLRARIDALLELRGAAE